MTLAILIMWFLGGALVVWLSVEQRRDVRTSRAEDDAERENERCQYPAGQHPTAKRCLYCGKEL